MAYTTIDNPELYFQVKTYSGAGGSQAQTLDGSEDMASDMIWIKCRDQAENHGIYDTIRGATELLVPHFTAGEVTLSTGLTAFGSDGFTVAGSGTTGYSGQTYAAWCWKAGGSGSSNADGAISTTRSLNADAGISIMKYTGSGSGSNIAHGLGATPDLIIRKNISGTEDWYVHSILIDGSHDYLKLNTADAKADSGLTASTSTLIYTAADSADHIVYAFKSIQGYQKMGTYEGSGSTTDNTFVYLGFSPAMIIVKAIDTANQWNIFDNKRNTGNPMDKRLFADASDAETTYASFDFLSNGFKVRNTSVGIGTADTFMYYAVAEAPFVTGSGGVPCNAR